MYTTIHGGDRLSSSSTMGFSIRSLLEKAGGGDALKDLLCKLPSYEMSELSQQKEMRDEVADLLDIASDYRDRFDIVCSADNLHVDPVINLLFTDGVFLKLSMVDGTIEVGNQSSSSKSLRLEDINHSLKMYMHDESHQVVSHLPPYLQVHDELEALLAIHLISSSEGQRTLHNKRPYISDKAFQRLVDEALIDVMPQQVYERLLESIEPIEEIKHQSDCIEDQIDECIKKQQSYRDLEAEEEQGDLFALCVGSRSKINGLNEAHKELKDYRESLESQRDELLKQRWDLIQVKGDLELRSEILGQGYVLVTGEGHSVKPMLGKKLVESFIPSDLTRLENYDLLSKYTEEEYKDRVLKVAEDIKAFENYVSIVKVQLDELNAIHEKIDSLVVDESLEDDFYLQYDQDSKSAQELQIETKRSVLASMGEQLNDLYRERTALKEYGQNNSHYYRLKHSPLEVLEVLSQSDSYYSFIWKNSLRPLVSDFFKS